MMRLKTVNPKIDVLFVNAVSAKYEFERLFWSCFGELDEMSQAELKKFRDLACLLENRLPDLQGKGDLVESLDNYYFDAEDAGNDQLASSFFKLARITAAVVKASSAVTAEEFADAAYEAIMSVDDPEIYSEKYLLGLS